MKKISGLLIVAMIAFTLMTGAAFAGSITTSLGTGVTLGYPGEADVLATIQINFDTGALINAPPGVVSTCGGDGTVQILYTTTSDLPSSARIIFHLANATWPTVKMYLLDATPPDSVTPPSFATLAGTDVITASDATFIIGNNLINANSILVLSTREFSAGGPTSPTIIIGGNAPGTTITLGVPQCYDAVGTIQGCLASPVGLVSIYQQFSWQYSQRTKTIDVNAPSLRTMFLPYHGSGSGGGEHNARAPLGLINSAYGNCGDTWRLSLDNAGGNIATLQYTLADPGGQLNKLDEIYIQLENSPYDYFDFTTNSAGTQATLSVAASEEYGLHDRVIDTLVLALEEMVTSPPKLNPDSFFITAALHFANASLYADVNLPSTKIIIWDINGWVGTVPYMFASSVATEDTFIKIFNNSSVDGEVTVDVTPDAGGTVLNVSLGTIDAGTIGIRWAASIAEAAGLPLNSAFGAVFTVNAPQNSITAMANQKRPGAVDRVVPIYTGSEGYKVY